jgi:hypothetical protein
LITPQPEQSFDEGQKRRRDRPALQVHRALQADAADHRQLDMPVEHPELVQPGRVALALALEAREAASRPLTLHALEEAVEGPLEINERLLADMRGDLVQPRTLAPLQPDEPLPQLAVSGTLPGLLVLALGLREAPVVDVPARPDALRQEHTLRAIRARGRILSTENPRSGR